MGGNKRQLELVLRLQDEASKELRKFAGEVDAVDRKTLDWSKSLGIAKKALTVASAAAAGFLGYGVKIAADLQTAEVGLTTLLGSAEAARRTMDRLKKEAARTPFELPGLTQAAQLLTSVTKDGDKSIDIILDVGEALAAMGKGQAELDRIIVNLQQIAATGRAATIDIRQFAFAGIPIYEMLTETTGKSGEALEELITSGGVTFDLLTQMFDEANDAGGRFFGAFENQSGTFNQAMSNMKDSLGIFAADLAQSTGLMDALTSAMMGISDFVGDWRGNMERLGNTFEAFIDMIDEQTGLITHLRVAWGEVSAAFRDDVMPALQELWVALEPLHPYFEALAKLLGVMLVATFHTVIAVVRYLALGLANLITVGAQVATFISKTLKPTFDGITVVIQKVTDFVEDLIKAFQKAIRLAREIGGGAIDFVSGLLPGRASGGPVTAGRAYMVGEKGPELFVPSNSGSIVPNNRLGATGGGGETNHLHIYLDGREIGEAVFGHLMGDMKLNARLA